MGRNEVARAPQKGMPGVRDMSAIRFSGVIALLVLLAVPGGLVLHSVTNSGVPLGTSTAQPPALIGAPPAAVNVPASGVSPAPSVAPPAQLTAGVSPTRAVLSSEQLTTVAESLAPSSPPRTNPGGQAPSAGSSSPSEAPVASHPASSLRPASAPTAEAWAQICSTCAPSARSLGMMAYDSADGYVVLYGGESSSGSFDSDTWTYSAGTWTQDTASTFPPARVAGAFAWDGADNELVLFGGANYYGTEDSDTWTFAGGVWTQAHPSTVPQARYASGMTYDAADGYLVMYGGYTTAAGGANGKGWPEFGDLWEFKAGQWTSLPMQGTLGTPTYLSDPNMAYDAYDGYVVLFGGKENSFQGYSPYTWEYNGGYWYNLSSSVGPPTYNCGSITCGEEMAFDAKDQRIVYETATGSSTEETWLFQSGTWTQDTATAPPYGWNGGMGFDAKDDYVLYFGGSGGSGGEQTWAFPGALSATVSTSQPGVDEGQPLTVSANVVGGAPTYSYLWSNLPGGCMAANQVSITCTPNAQGTTSITVKVTDSGGRQVTSPGLSFTVSAPPTVGTPSGSEPFSDAHEPVSFSTTTSGGPGTYWSYSWSLLPTGCSSVNASTLPCTPSSPGTYAVKVSVTDGNHDTQPSSSLSYIVLSNPGVTLAVKPTLVDVGQSVTFWANATGGSGVYTISYNNLPSGCASANVSVLVCAPGASSSSVTASVVDTVGGTATSSPVSFVVDSDPTLSTTFTTGGSPAYANQSLVLKLNYGSGSPNYRPCISAPGSILTGVVCGAWQGGSSYSFSFTYTAAGTYSVIASIRDSTGWNTTQTLSENVDWPLAPGPARLPSVLDSGMTANATVQVVHGMPTFSVFWNDTTSSTPLCSVSPSSDGASVCPFVPGWTGTHTVEVTVRDSEGLAEFSNLTLPVNAPLGGLSLTASVGSFTAHLGGTLEDEVGANGAFSASYSGGTGPFTTTWSYNGSVVMGSGSPLTYAWVHPSTYGVSFVATDSLGKSVGGSLTVVVYPNPSGLVLSTHLTQLDVGTSDNLSLNFSGGLAPFTFSWDMGDGTVTTSPHPWFVHAWASAGTFTCGVTIQDAAGGRTAKSIPLTIQPDPSVANATARSGGAVSGAGGTLGTLVNQTVSFSGRFTGGLGPYHYSWAANSTVIGSGVGNGPWFNLSYRWNGTGYFTVAFQVTDVQGHTSSASLTVLVRPDVFSSILLGSSWAQPDAGAPVNLTLSFQGGVGPYTYGWILGDGNGTYTSVPWFVHAYGRAGTYLATVVVRDSLGGTGSASLHITVVAGLTVPCAPTANSTLIWAGEAVSLSLGCAAGGTQPYTYAWAFGDGGSSSAGSSATHTFASAGNYSIVVVVNDSGGSSVRSSVLSFQVLAISEVTPYLQSVAWHTDRNVSNGDAWELRLNVSAQAVSTYGTVTGLRLATSLADLDSAPWQPLGRAFLWFNVTASNDSPTIYVQVENSLGRTSAPYSFTHSYATLFPSPGTKGDGSLSVGELFLLAAGIALLALVAIVAVLMVIRRKKGGSLGGGSSGESPDKVTQQIQDRIAKSPGIDRESLVSAVAGSTRTSPATVETKLLFLVETHQLVEIEDDDGRKTYTLPDVASATPAPVQESLEIGHKLQLLEDEMAKQGDLIPLDELVPFGETLGLDKTKLATLIGDNSGVSGAFVVTSDPATPGSILVSLSAEKKAARKLPPITLEPLLDPSRPANENFVQEAFPERRVSVQIDSETRGEP
jgi:PKD repeat protein